MPGSRKARGNATGPLSTINVHAAGLDVGATFHVVAVPADRDEEPVRTFRTFSSDLHHLADWLTATGITTIAMESTGVYWIPVFELLESRGFEVLLVNARDVKHVSGRKTDVMRSGCSSSISMAFFGAASGPATPWSGCALTCAIGSVWWNTPPRISSTCRRRSCR